MVTGKRLGLLILCVVKMQRRSVCDESLDAGYSSRRPGRAGEVGAWSLVPLGARLLVVIA